MATTKIPARDFTIEIDTAYPGTPAVDPDRRPQLAHPLALDEPGRHDRLRLQRRRRAPRHGARPRVHDRRATTSKTP